MHLSDETFNSLVFIIGSLALGYSFVNWEGFEALSHSMQQIATYIVISGCIIFILIIIGRTFYKIYASRRNRVNHTTDKESPKNFEESTTKKELPESMEQGTTKEEPSEIIEEEKTISSTKARPERSAKVEDINIELDDEVRFYNLRKLNEHEIDYLKHMHFITRTCFNPFTKRKEYYIFLKNSNEGERHFLITNLIVEYLRKKVDKINTYQTVKPDIIFEIKEKRIALEIESGKVLKHNKKNLIEKVKSLKDNYDDWFFVVTNRNLASKYRQFGKVIDLRYIHNQLKKLIQNLTLN